jgi:hypothetical protein
MFKNLHGCLAKVLFRGNDNVVSQIKCRYIHLATKLVGYSLLKLLLPNSHLQSLPTLAGNFISFKLLAFATCNPFANTTLCKPCKG